MSGRARTTRVIALAAWLLLVASIAAWPFGASGIAAAVALLAALPLLLPIPGMARGRRRSFGWAPLMLAPALALSLTEILVNVPGRPRASLTLALVFASFAALVAALRAIPRD